MRDGAASVGFVMPVFNGLRHLDEAVESVRRQDDPRWTLLAIDDASTDGSLARLRELAARDDRIRVVAQVANRGLYGTLAAAVDQVGAQWLAILMQDDRLRQDYLREMTGLIARFPAADAFWATEHVIDADGRVVAAGRDTGRIENIAPGPDAWRHALRQGCLWTISGSLTRRSLLQAVRLRSDLPHCGDYDFFLRALRDRRFVYYERPLAELRRHDEQASAHNVRSGRDLREALLVVREQVRAHPDDVPMPAALEISAHRAVGVVVRLAAAVRHLRFRQVPGLVGHLWSCLRLPLDALWSRGRGPSPAAGEPG